jgi:hypothetical protein
MDSVRKYLEIGNFSAVIIGVVLVVWQIHVQNSRDLKERALTFAARLQQEPLADARVVVAAPWLEQNIEQLNRVGASSDIIDDLVRKVVEKNTSNDFKKDMRASIITLAEYLDSAQTCVETHVCDQSVIDSQLGPFARAFFCLYRPIVLETRRKTQLVNLGRNLENLVARNGQCDFST